MTIISEDILHAVTGACILGAALVADGGIILSAVLIAVAGACLAANYIINGEL